MPKRAKIVVWPINWSIPTSAYVKFTRENKRIKSWEILGEDDEVETISWSAYRMFTKPALEANAEVDEREKITLGSVAFPTGVFTFEGLGSLFGAE